MCTREIETDPTSHSLRTLVMVKSSHYLNFYEIKNSQEPSISSLNLLLPDYQTTKSKDKGQLNKDTAPLSSRMLFLLRLRLGACI